MAFIQTTPPDQAKGGLRTMYEQQQAKFGYVPNYAKVFGERLDILALWADLLSGIRKHIDPRRFELVTFAAACQMRNSYCALAHGKVLEEKFLSAEAIRATVGNESSAELSEAEVAMMHLARKVVEDSSSITREDIDALRAHGLADEEIFDVVATAAGRAFFAKLCESLGAEPDAAYMELDEELRTALTVGSAISSEDPERIS